MKNITATLSVLLAVAATASAHEPFWDRDTVAEVKASLPAKAVDTFHKGTLTVGGKTTEVCFELKGAKVDEFEYDPDIRKGVFVYQDIPTMVEAGRHCETALQHNGRYIRTCSGLYLMTETGLGKGDIFDKLERFDPQTGKLVRQPVGRYNLSQAGSCGTFAGDMSPASMKSLAGRLAGQSQDHMIGNYVSHSCTTVESFIECDFKYDLAAGICWYGYEHITATFDPAPPYRLIHTESGWSAD